MILNPSASHFAFAKDEIRQRFVLEGSRAFGVTYLYANMLGNESGRAIFDGGAMIASAGKMVAIGPQFSFADVLVTSAVVDLDRSRMSRAASGSYMPIVESTVEEVISVPFNWPRQWSEDSHRASLRTNIPAAPWPNATDKEEEFTHAETLGLFDYLRKSHSHGFVLSLSGGADSSALCVLVGYMVRFAVQELGLDGVRKKLAYIPAVQAANSTAEIVARAADLRLSRQPATAAPSHSTPRAKLPPPSGPSFCTSTSMASSSNTPGSSKGPSAASSPGRPTTSRCKTSRPAFARPVFGCWRTFAARCCSRRATAAKRPSATRPWTATRAVASAPWPASTRTSSGTGSAGSRRSDPAGAEPLPALRYVNEQAPTAELRPAENKQTDEGDLMPYDVLDAIERAAIRDKRSPLETYQCVRPLFPQHTRADLGLWVERFFTLWCRNQWKRERYAPSFHLDDENLDPKTWCGFDFVERICARAGGVAGFFGRREVSSESARSGDSKRSVI